MIKILKDFQSQSILSSPLCQKEENLWRPCCSVSSSPRQLQAPPRGVSHHYSSSRISDEESVSQSQPRRP